MSKSLGLSAHQKDITYFMEVHSALSAKIAEAAGFKALWASGLSISTALGLRDANEASWTQVLDVAEYIVDAVDVPVLLDGDTGYGNFNNVRRLVGKLCSRGVAGVCLEDKLFPKTNSFVSKEQELCTAREFVGKIKAAKDSQLNSNFTVVARTEAFIVGAGLDIALERAMQYAEAGADAIFVHSKKEDYREIESFMSKWQNKVPIIIAPTTYFKTTAEQFQEQRISGVIWANHNLRTSMKAMQDACASIMKRQSVAHIESQISSVKEIFDLVDNDELLKAENIYL